MPYFHYRAASPDGKIVQSTIEGENERSIRTHLEGQGLLILELGGSKKWSVLPTLSWKRKSLTLRDFLVFNQQFLALIKAGLPILRTFDILYERAPSGGFQEALLSVREEIRGGASISEAMSSQPTYFPELYQASIRSGEHAGSLTEILQRYIGYLKLIIGVREKVVKALAYPSFLVLIGLGVVAFLLAYVMPTFAEVYAENKTELPLATKILLDTITNIDTWLPWALLCLTVSGALLYSWGRTPTGQLQIHWLLLHLPLVGDVVLKNQVIRLTRTLATTLAGGISLLAALQITGRAMTNHVFSRALSTVIGRVRDGMSLANSLKQEAFLPRMTTEMIEVGETTGSLETMLLEVAEFHEGELDLQLSRLTTWIEPLLLLIMGIMVGGLVIIMYLPIFELAGAV